MAKRRRYNPNRVRRRRCYTCAEIADIYRVHTRTVQGWRKDGLTVVADKSRPYLVLGAEVRRFLKEAARKRRHPLKLGEFFCPRCKQPRRSIENQIRVEFTGKRLGRYQQAILKGLCEVCGCSLHLFSSDRKVKELREMGLTLTERETTLIGNADGSLNSDIRRGENREDQCKE